jgi:cyanophycinase
MASLRTSDRALIIVGGHEDKEGDKLILRAIADRVHGGKLVIITAASNHQEELGDEYERLFRGLGVRHVYKLPIESRDEAVSDRSVSILKDATTIFFTGGDQLRITSLLGCSPVCERIQEIYESGGTIAGTSAGASVMTETMMVEGDGESTHRLGSGLSLAPGLGLMRGTIVDQHFSERGRLGRLLAAIAQNPRILGIGIDENTAIILEQDNRFTVVGDGGVIVLDAGAMTYSNVADEQRDRSLSAFDVKLHVLSQGDVYYCQTRRPREHPADVIEEELLGASR